MAGRKPPSEALRAFCDKVNCLGGPRLGPAWRTVKPTHVESWAGWCLVPPLDRPGRGRGRGREPAYTDEHAVAVVETAELVRRHRSIPVAVAVLFLRGRPLPVETLRRAYITILERAEADVARLAERERERLGVPADAPTSPSELAEAAAAQRLKTAAETKNLRASLRELGLGVEGTIEVMTAVMLQTSTSGLTEPSDLAEVRRRFNLPEFCEPPAKDSVLPTDAEIMRLGSTTELKETLRRSTADDFEHARKTVRSLTRLTHGPRGKAALATYGLGEVLGVFGPPNEKTEALLLLQTLMFRVRFRIDLLAVLQLLIDAAAARSDE